MKQWKQSDLRGLRLCILLDCPGALVLATVLVTIPIPGLARNHQSRPARIFNWVIICSAWLSTATVIHQTQLDHNLVGHFTVLGSASGFTLDSPLIQPRVNSGPSPLASPCTRLWSRFAWLSASQHTSRAPLSTSQSRH